MSSATPTVSTGGTSVIATVQALTTEFVAPSTCYSMQLTMLSSPGYFIWLNEPQPVPGTLYPDCYPSQFIDGYSSVYNASSSIAPMMSPLVAPENWITAKEMDDGYIALCPSGFQLHDPDTSVVDSNRPAYGATCYSKFTAGVTVTVSGYDSQGYTGTVPFVPVSGDQAYAHVIEGKKASSTVSGASTSGTGVMTSTPTGSAASETSAAGSGATESTGNTVSGGTIAGAVVGSVAGFALIVAAIFFLFRRRRKQNLAGSGTNEHSSEMGAATAYSNSTGYNDSNGYHHGDKALPAVPLEGTGSPDTPYNRGHPDYENYAELPEQGHSTFEMESPQGPTSHVRELDTGYHGTELDSNYQNAGRPQN